MLQKSLKVVMVFYHHFPNYDSTKVAQEAYMNKTTSIHIWHFLLASVAAVMLAGCGVMASTITPTPQSPTTMPPYIHYTASEGFNIHLEFDYPGSWTFSEEMQEGGLSMVVGLGNPRFRTLPTPFPEDSHPTPNDFGSVVIRIVPSQPDQTPNTKVESLKQSYNSHFRYKVLNDYKITIDGYDASVLEYQVEPAQDDYPSVMFNRRTFFMVKDQMYEIHFTVAEKERGGEFEKGYEYFFNSLKIVP